MRLNHDATFPRWKASLTIRIRIKIVNNFLLHDFGEWVELELRVERARGPRAGFEIFVPERQDFFA